MGIATRTLPFGEAARNALLSRYRYSARKKNKEFSIGKELFTTLTSLNCRYCGSKPSNRVVAGEYNGDYTYNGLDRVDNTKGYTEDNVVPCCEICNKAKREMSEDAFIEWVLQVAKHMIKLNVIKVDMTGTELQLARIADAMEGILKTTNPIPYQWEPDHEDTTERAFYTDENLLIIDEHLRRMGKEPKPRTPRK